MLKMIKNILVVSLVIIPTCYGNAAISNTSKIDPEKFVDQSLRLFAHAFAQAKGDEKKQEQIGRALSSSMQELLEHANNGGVSNNDDKQKTNSDVKNREVAKEKLEKIIHGSNVSLNGFKVACLTLADKPEEMDKIFDGNRASMLSFVDQARRNGQENKILFSGYQDKKDSHAILMEGLATAVRLTDEKRMDEATKALLDHIDLIACRSYESGRDEREAAEKYQQKMTKGQNDVPAELQLIANTNKNMRIISLAIGLTGLLSYRTNNSEPNRLHEVYAGMIGAGCFGLINHLISMKPKLWVSKKSPEEKS